MTDTKDTKVPPTATVSPVATPAPVVRPPEKVETKVEVKPAVEPLPGSVVVAEEELDEEVVEIVEVKEVPIVCDVCKDTGAVAAEYTVDAKTGEKTVTKWANCTNCYLDKDAEGNYVRKLGVKPDPEQLKKELADKKKILDARAEEERLKTHRVA